MDRVCVRAHRKADELINKIETEDLVRKGRKRKKE
jgi:hypothetical protein